MKSWWICSKCWYSYSTFSCMRCSTSETKQEEVKQIVQPKKEITKLLITKEKINKEVIQPKQISNTNHWLELHTASYLHNNLKKNLNSIKQEKICIKVWDKYILHSDIIEKFKKDYFV